MIGTSRMRTVVASMAVGVALLVPSAAQGADDAALDALRRTLDVGAVNPEVNGSAGVYVWDTARQEALLRFITLFIARTLASNTKLFTSAAVLGTYGSGARLRTRALAGGPLGADGVLDGDLYLVGAGDPTFGTAATIASRYAGRRREGRGSTRSDRRLRRDADRRSRRRRRVAVRQRPRPVERRERAPRPPPRRARQPRALRRGEAHPSRSKHTESTSPGPRASACARPGRRWSPRSSRRRSPSWSSRRTSFGSILRRDAAAQPSGGLRRARDDRRRLTEVLEAVALGLGAELDQVDGSGLNSGKVVGAGPGRAAARRDARAACLPRVRRRPADRGRRRDARGPHARHAGDAALPGEDRDAQLRQRTLGLLPASRRTPRAVPRS